MMRVACIGNMNNNFFSLARHLRDRGIHADVLLLAGEPMHFHPSADTFDLNFQSMTRQLSWGLPFDYATTDHKKVERDLAPYDVLIACGTGPAYINACGRRVDIFVPYGTDVLEYLFIQITNPFRQLRHSRFCISQRAGILNAPYLCMDPINGEFEAVVKRLDYQGTRVPVSIPMVYTPLYSPQTIEAFRGRGHWNNEFARIRAANDLVVFHHARHVGKTIRDPLAIKRNDILIRGFARFVREMPAMRACLICIEYGADVGYSKALVKNLEFATASFGFRRCFVRT